MAKKSFDNRIYYGDNLEILRKYIKDETIDLCYIDPPFNSKRNYNQIYNNIGGEDKAQAQAFTDTWTWDEYAIKGYDEITSTGGGIYTRQCVDLTIGLRNVLGESSLMSYIISMTLRIAEIHRVLKPTGSFFLHCDPTASHYLKLVLDAVFCGNEGEFQNEIIWHYRRWTNVQRQFQSMHDVILYYTKTDDNLFNFTEVDMSESQRKKFIRGWDSNVIHTAKESYSQLIVYDKSKYEQAVSSNKINPEKYKNIIFREKPIVAASDVIIMPALNSQARERLGYPTQKPEGLLEKLILATTNKGGIVLDAYCGCGTTVAVAQKLERKWIGIDITYQSIAIIIKRLKEHFGQEVIDKTEFNGIPKDMDSAIELAHKKDDRVRKEFEKWAVLTYSDNRAIVNEKKGADSGIDGIAYMLVGHDEHKQVLFSVKSGHLGITMIRDFCHVVERDGAAMGVFITLEEPTKPMIKEAKNMGMYKNPLTHQEYPKISIVTIAEILNDTKLDLPQAVEVLKEAQLKKEKLDNPLGLGF